MTKEEAQAIIDSVDKITIIDSNWLNYLISDPEFKILKAIHVIFNMDYNQFLKQYEGHSISGFQTYNGIYVGRLIKIDGLYFLITSQDDEKAYYITRGGYIGFYNLINVKNYLV